MADIRHHHLKYQESPSGLPAEWAAWIMKIEGVTGVKVNTEENDLYVEYDLLQCTEEEIEKHMTEVGFVLDGSFLERLKRGWVHYTEENELDAMHAPKHTYDPGEFERRKKESG